jgi:hypothetical protein
MPVQLGVESVSSFTGIRTIKIAVHNLVLTIGPFTALDFIDLSALFSSVMKSENCNSLAEMLVAISNPRQISKLTNDRVEPLVIAINAVGVVSSFSKCEK